MSSTFGVTAADPTSRRSVLHVTKRLLALLARKGREHAPVYGPLLARDLRAVGGRVPAHGVGSLGRAPALSIALFGSVIAAVVGFFVADANGPSGVPAIVAFWASWVSSCAVSSACSSPARAHRRGPCAWLS
jgi:hypothetical protein